MKLSIELKNSKGFTLIELLVVISIIGLLAAITLVSLNLAREKAKVARSVADIRNMMTAIEIYRNDTGVMPPACETCTMAQDPFLNSLGVPGWRGPYLSMWDRAHPWSGHEGLWVMDITGDGVADYLIALDEDRPNTDQDNNSAQIPTASLIAIDKILDDGNLSTGKVVGNGVGGTVVGELVLRYTP